jgi:hypothetical protein
VFIKSFFSIFFLLLFLAQQAAPGFSSPNQASYLANNDVIIIFDQKLEKTAVEILKYFPKLKTELEGTLGWKLSYRPQINLYQDNTVFQRTVKNPYIVAYALPSQGLMVIDYSKMNRSPFKVETTIKHELCHLILHGSIQDSLLPRWLDEGIAQWVCGGIAEVVIQGEEDLLDSAVLSGRLIPMESLRKRFPDDEYSFLLSYAQSKSMVEFIINGYGEKGLKDLLDRLKKGYPIDVAVSDLFSLSLFELENQWKAHLKRQAVWLTYFIHHLYEFLFLLGGLLLVFGFIKIWLRKRSMIDEYSHHSEE